MDKNVDYYNKNAVSFFESTVNADMSLWRDKFESYLPNGGKILDAGCGSGRDSLAFLRHGLEVVAFDAASEMCRMASELLNMEVKQMRFEDVDFENEFEGIWACASLLHVPMEGFPDVLRRLRNALKPNGILYVSFKYGTGSKLRGERSFIDYEENAIREVLQAEGFSVVECGITTDVRPGRGDEKWINAIAKRNEQR